MTKKTPAELAIEKKQREDAITLAEKAYNDFEVKEPADLQKSFDLLKAVLELKGADNVKNFDEKIAAIEAAAEEAKTAKQDEIEKLKSDLATTIKGFDLLQTRVKGVKLHTPENQSFKDQLHEAMEKRKDDVANYTKNDRRPVSFDLKAVGNMGSGNLTTSGTETFAGNTFMGIGRKPYELTHLRNIIPVTSIGTDSAYVVRDASGEGGPTAVAMAAAKPQSDRDYVKLIQPVTKIAHYFKIPEEMLEDSGWLQNEISTVGIEDLLSKEDDLILNQVAGAGLFAGLVTATNSTAYASPASLALAIEGANNYDVLVAAWTQLRTLKTSANYILCHPADYARMVLSKATTGEYVFGAPNVSIPNVFGIPLIPHTAMTSDKFLIGDFGKVKIGQRAGISVRFYDQNEDDAIKNMVTIVIEERLTVIADRADRLVYGDFSDARAALETA